MPLKTNTVLDLTSQPRNLLGFLSKKPSPLYWSLNYQHPSLSLACLSTSITLLHLASQLPSTSLIWSLNYHHYHWSCLWVTITRLDIISQLLSVAVFLPLNCHHYLLSCLSTLDLAHPHSNTNSTNVPSILLISMIGFGIPSKKGSIHATIGEANFFSIVNISVINSCVICKHSLIVDFDDFVRFIGSEYIKR